MGMLRPYITRNNLNEKTVCYADLKRKQTAARPSLRLTVPADTACRAPPDPAAPLQTAARPSLGLTVPADTARRAIVYYIRSSIVII